MSINLNNKNSNLKVKDVNEKESTLSPIPDNSITDTENIDDIKRENLNINKNQCKSKNNIVLKILDIK